jgi:hypothetical protein
MTPNDVIAEVRREVQDNALLRTPDSYVATTLLSYVNRVLKQTCVLRPDLFAFVGDIVPTPNTVTQTLPDDSMRLVDIFSVKDGNSICEVSRETLDQTHPMWRTDEPGAPVNYMRHIKNPNVYFLYPRPSTGIVLVGEYVKTPANYTVNQDIPQLPDTYLPVLVTGVCALVYGTDNATQDRQKFIQFQELYAQALGVNLQARAVTDTKASGMNPKEVL